MFENNHYRTSPCPHRFAGMRLFILPLALCSLTACSGASQRPLPPIAADLPPDVRQAEKLFDRRVKAAFVVGTPESSMVSALAKDGFEIGSKGADGYRAADLKRGDIICQTIWSVRWRAEAANIEVVSGVYGHRCP